jgi:hypothetical protein
LSALTLAAMALACPEVAAAAPPQEGPRKGVVGVGAGIVHLTNIAADAHDGVQPWVRGDIGWMLSEKTNARFRIEGYRADGLNLTFSLVAEWQTWRNFGFYAASGLSYGRDTRVGNNTVLGSFARFLPDHRLSPRIDVFGAAAIRNDFLSIGAGLTLGLDVRWGPR